MSSTDPIPTLIARLQALSPDAAAEALRQHNFLLKKNNKGTDACEEIERTLLDRDERIIDLSLAQYGICSDILTRLYERSLVGTGNTIFDLGIRTCVLANNIAPERFFEKNPGISEEELRRLAEFGTEPEIKALLTNPLTRSYIGDLYRRKPPFENLDDNRFLSLVRASLGNPALHFEDRSPYGPDGHFFEIQTGICQIFKTVPVTTRWFWILDFLLETALPYFNFRDEGSDGLATRWLGLELKDFNSEENEKGFYTDLTRAEEFSCRIASMGGHEMHRAALKEFSGPGIENVISRCAYYGQAKMSVPEMRSAFGKDREIFAFAALHNSHFYENPLCRSTLLSMLSGDVHDLYARGLRNIENLRNKKWLEEIENTERDCRTGDADEEENAPQLATFEENLDRIHRATADLKNLIWVLLILLVVVLWRLKI